MKKAILAYINVPSGTHLKTSRTLKNRLQEKTINSPRFEAGTSSSVTLLCITNSRATLLENSDADFEPEHTISSALQSCSVDATALATKHLWMWIKPSLTAGMLIYFPTGTLRPLSIHKIINRFYCFVTAHATNKKLCH